MKSLSLLITLFLSMNVFAGDDVLRMQLLDVKESEMENSLELVTTSVDFEKVVLDCHSFITGMNFMKDGTAKSQIYIDAYECQRVYDLIVESNTEKKPLCLELNPEKNKLVFSRKTSDCQ